MFRITFRFYTALLAKISPYLLLLFLVVGCSQDPTAFSEEAMTEKVISSGGDILNWQDVLADLKGRKAVIDFWATWCRDCIENFEELSQLKQEYPDVNFVYVSLDRGEDAWKWGIDKYNLEGKHYFLPNGKSGAIGDFLNLWWIPRYVVIDEDSNILIFKATSAEDLKLKTVLQ